MSGMPLHYGPWKKSFLLFFLGILMRGASSQPPVLLEALSCLKCASTTAKTSRGVSCPRESGPRLRASPGASTKVPTIINIAVQSRQAKMVTSLQGVLQRENRAEMHLSVTTCCFILCLQRWGAESRSRAQCACALKKWKVCCSHARDPSIAVDGRHGSHRRAVF